MLYVTDLNGNTEPLNHIQRVEINEEVNGAFTLALTSFFHPNNPGHALIEEESVIHTEGYDFRVKQMKENRGRKEVVALSTFFDLVGHRQDEIYGGTRTFNEFASFVFGGTGWTFESVDVSGSQFIPNFGTDNVIKLITTLCKVYECEYKILPNQHVQFAKQVGPDNDAQYRYGHNVQALSKSVDTTNLRTVIKGFGGNGLAITYTSPYAEKYGEIEADPIENEDYFTADEMLPVLKKELQDYPEVSIELDSIELSDKETGERVWLIYDPMDIEFQTRAMSKKSTIRNGKWVTLSVTIGNTVPRSLSDILTDVNINIDENNKRTKSRIEQTNDRITFAVEQFAGEMLEAYSKIELTASEIRSEVAALNVQLEDGIAQNKSLISQTATQIRSEVTSEVRRVDGRVDSANSSITQLAGQVSIKADSSTVSSLGTRVNNVEWNLDATNAQISQKVSQTDYNGNTIVSMINQTPYYVEINADKINLVGAVSVLSDISGDLGTITAGNINIWESAYIGAGLYLRGGAGGQYTGIYFGSTQIHQQTDGWLRYEGGMQGRGAFMEFTGRVDFSKATVVGLK
ncbi:phage tail protein [Sporosarcina newyorkensis]|uniref:phage tail protein n=1 Tax=Sporosarcina newyorkensis TaxID=759851 RepID=UPI003D092AE9